MKARPVLRCLASAAIFLNMKGCVDLVGLVVVDHATQVVDCTVDGKPARVQRQFCDPGSEKK